MVAAYWENEYNLAKAEEVTPEKKKAVNEGVAEIQMLLKLARTKLHSLEYVGGEYTVYKFPRIYQELDRMMETLHSEMTKMNATENPINLEDYPV